MSKARNRQTAPQPLARRTHRLRLAIYALLVTTIFTLPIYAAHTYSLHSLSLAERPDPASLTLLYLADTAQTATFIITIFMFLAWIHRRPETCNTYPG